MKKDMKQEEIISTDKIQDTFKIKDFKEKNKCTYFEYGDIPIFQEAFCCEVCDPNKTEMICAECFNHCHKNCRSEEIREDFSNIEEQKRKRYILHVNVVKKSMK